MSKNFNNNTIVDSRLNLQVATLNTNLLTNYPTNTTISTLMANTVQSQTVLRDAAIASSLTSANLFTSNSLLNYSSTILTNTAISNAINLNNTSNISYTNSKIVTEVVDRNTAITTIQFDIISIILYRMYCNFRKMFAIGVKFILILLGIN